MDNTVTLVGNCGRDPELRYTQGGQAMAEFSLAVTRRWGSKAEGTQQEQTSWFDVKCWGQLAENVCESIAKGERVVVTGRLEQQSWETDSGEKRNKVSVTADEVGPSLRWATAHVVKNDRRDGQGEGVMVNQQRGQQQRRPAYEDEEPF